MPAVDTLKEANSYYQHVVVRGLPYDRGFSHGTQVKDKIHTNVAYYKLPGKLPCAYVSRMVFAALNFNYGFIGLLHLV
jgi:hypothetical protein